MVKKTVEIEVEYPDCVVCGKGIFGEEKFYKIYINLSLMTCERDGHTHQVSEGNSPLLIICEKCLLNENAKQKIIEEIEKIRQIAWQNARFFLLADGVHDTQISRQKA